MWKAECKEKGKERMGRNGQAKRMLRSTQPVRRNNGTGLLDIQGPASRMTPETLGQEWQLTFLYRENNPTQRNDELGYPFGLFVLSLCISLGKSRVYNVLIFSKV
jgi:hypothetical protein